MPHLLVHASYAGACSEDTRSGWKQTSSAGLNLERASGSTADRAAKLQYRQLLPFVTFPTAFAHCSFFARTHGMCMGAEGCATKWLCPCTVRHAAGMWCGRGSKLHRFSTCSCYICTMLHLFFATNSSAPYGG